MGLVELLYSLVSLFYYYFGIFRFTFFPPEKAFQSTKRLLFEVSSCCSIYTSMRDYRYILEIISSQQSRRGFRQNFAWVVQHIDSIISGKTLKRMHRRCESRLHSVGDLES